MRNQHSLFRLALLIIFILLGYSFSAAASYRINGVYYYINSTNGSAIVTHGDIKYSGNVTIPSSVTIEGKTYTVETIGSNAFFECNELTRVTLPNSITSIQVSAFEDCTGLTSVNVPNSVTSIGPYAFINCPKITSINIPNSLTLIESKTFYGCTRLTNVNIPKNVKKIGSGAFGFCKALTNVNIPDSVTSIGSEAFKYCSGLTSVDIPTSVNHIGYDAFAGCTNLDRVVVLRAIPPSGASGMFPANQLIYVPSVANYSNSNNWKSYNLKGFMYNVETSLTKAKINSISDDCRLISISTSDKTYNATNSTITISGLLPNNSYDVTVRLNFESDLYEFNDIITTKPITLSSLQSNSTQSTLNTSFTVNRDEGFVIEACGVSCNSTDFAGSINGTTSDKYTIGCRITGLSPQTTYYCKPWVQYKGEKYYGNSISLSTAAVGVNNTGTVGPTSVNYTATYSAGDAHVTNAYFTFQGEQSKDLKKTGLEPNRNYSYTYTIVTGNGNQSNSYSFKTPVLTMSTQTARMLTNTTAMFIAETNMADEETSCGFEWRRYDAPDEMPSTKVYCPVYGGVMAGTLKRMTENVYYKYRPFYRSSTGNEYYGNWIAFITADAGVEFEPVVYTYNSPAVSQNDATLQGVALRGSDEITEQGFEYWKAGSSSTLNAGNNIIKVNATGERMSATVNNLAPGTKYVFRAFVTAGGKTKRGAEVQFVTLSSSMDVNGDGEINIADVNSIVNAILIHKGDNIYDVNGDGEINIADINAIIQSILSGK